MTHRSILLATVFLLIPGLSRADEKILLVKTPMTPPAWALLERELLRAQSAACREFFERYFDERGYLMCVERWGGDDGPDDAIENCTGWPILHALGAHDDVFHMYKKAWEGHLRQYTAARTTKVPMARDGMYYKEFPVQFDWLHNGEGLTVFNLQGLSDPNDRKFRQRVRRYAGFYMNEDPGAANYDAKHKIIRSLFNGSRGPLMRKATPLDWAGDPIEVAGRFRLGHGEQSYDEMLAHFKDYTDIVGDHPQNLSATTLALNAYIVTHDEKYKRWLLEYVDAWRERILKNDGIIPTNIGLDGTIGGAAEGKWYGGVYGWGFTVNSVPDNKPVHRNTHHLGLAGFGNAFLLTGDDRFLNPWRKMIDKINAQGKEIDGQMQYPHMCGPKGWYAFKPEKYKHGALELWYWSMSDADKKRLPADGWFAYLDGKNQGHPEAALHADIARLRATIEAMRKETTTPDTRLADDPLPFNPAKMETLIRLMLGGLDPGNKGTALHCRVRYFDPKRRRAGIPEDVAALVEKLEAERTVITLVNVNQLEPRSVILQAGAYGEHQWTSVTGDGQTLAVKGPRLTVRLQPGTGARLELGTKRHVGTPTMALPWDEVGDETP